MNVSDNLIDLDDDEEEDDDRTESVHNRNQDSDEEGWRNHGSNHMKSSLNLIQSDDISENEEELEEQFYQDDQDAKNQENLIGDNDLEDQLDLLEEENDDPALLQRDGFGGILQALALIFGFNGPILDVFKTGLIYSTFCTLYLFLISLLPYFFGFKIYNILKNIIINFLMKLNNTYDLDTFLSISSDNYIWKDLINIFLTSSISFSSSSLSLSNNIISLESFTFIKKLLIFLILIKNKLISLKFFTILINVNKLSSVFNIPLNFFDFFFIIFGYFLIILTILFIHIIFFIILAYILKKDVKIDYVDVNTINQNNRKDLLLLIFKFLVAILKIIKLTLLLIFRIFFIPLFVGFFILLIFSSTILPYNALDWINFLTFNAIGIYALTWVCGISFMLFISLSTLQWREILHPNLIGKLIRPQEPHAELIRSLSDDSLFYHIKKFFSSFFVYILLLFISLYIPVSTYLSIMKNDSSFSNYNNLIVTILSTLVKSSPVSTSIDQGASVNLTVSSVLDSTLDSLINLTSFSSSAIASTTNSTILLKDQYNNTLYNLLPPIITSNNSTFLSSLTPFSIINSLSNSINMLTSNTNSSFFSYLYFWYLAPEVQAPLELLTFYVIYLTLLESRKDFIGYTQHMWLVFVTKKLDLIHYFLPCPIRAIIPYQSYLQNNSILSNIKLKSDEKIFQITQDHLDEFDYYYNKINTKEISNSPIRPPYNLNDFIIIGSPLRRPLKGWDSRKVIKGIRWSFVNEFPTETEYNLSPKIRSVNYFYLKMFLFYVIILLQFIFFTISIIFIPLNFGRFLMNVFYVPIPLRHDPFCFFLGLFLLSTMFIYFIDLIYYNYYKKYDRKNYLTVKVNQIFNNIEDEENDAENREENDPNESEEDRRKRREKENKEGNIIELPPGFDENEADEDEEEENEQINFFQHQQGQQEQPQEEIEQIPQVPAAPANNLTQSQKLLISSIYNFRLFNLVKNYFQTLHNPSSFRLFFELFLTCLFFGLLVYFASSFTLFDLSVVLSAFSSISISSLDAAASAAASASNSTSFSSYFFTPTSPISYFKLNADVMLNSPSFFTLQNYSIFVYFFKYIYSILFNSISLSDYHYFKSLGVENFNFSPYYTTSSSFLSSFLPYNWSLNNLNLLCLGEITIFPLPFYLFIPSILWVFLSGFLILSLYYYIVFRYNKIIMQNFKNFIPKKIKNFNQKNINFIKNINNILNQQVKQTILKQQAITFRQYVIPYRKNSTSYKDKQNLNNLLNLINQNNQNNNQNNQRGQVNDPNPPINEELFNQQYRKLLEHEALIKDPSQFNSNISLNAALKNLHYFLTFIIRKNLKIFFSLFFFVAILTFIIASLICRNFYFFEYTSIKNVNILLYNSKILFHANNNALLSSASSALSSATSTAAASSSLTSSTPNPSLSILSYLLTLTSSSSSSFLVSSIISSFEIQNYYPISLLNYLKPLDFVSLNNYNLFFISNYKIFLISLRLSCLITLFKLVFYFFFFIMKKIIWNFNRIIRDSKYLIGFQLLNYKNKKNN